MFQSSIAPKDDRNPPPGPNPIFPYVPILDRPERRSQYQSRKSRLSPQSFQSSIAPKDDRNTPRLGQCQSNCLFQSSIAPKDDRNLIWGTIAMGDCVPILDRPERRSQCPIRRSIVLSMKRSNPRSPRKTIAIHDGETCADRVIGVPILDRPERRSQSHMFQPGLHRNSRVPILDRPERRSQFGRHVIDDRP